MRVLGYVYTSYGKRNASEVRKDIQTYADWPTNSSDPNLAVRGIFFDETPQQYEAQTLTYLQGLTDFVKGLKALGPDQFVSTVMFLLYTYGLPHTIPPLSRIIVALYPRFFICFICFSVFPPVGPCTSQTMALLNSIPTPHIPPRPASPCVPHLGYIGEVH